MNRIRSLLSSISANQVQLMLFTDFRQLRVQIIDPRSFGSRWRGEEQNREEGEMAQKKSW